MTQIQWRIARVFSVRGGLKNVATTISFSNLIIFYSINAV